MEEGDKEGVAEEVESIEGSMVSGKLDFKKKVKCYWYVRY